jgi:hypothetical protein
MAEMTRRAGSSGRSVCGVGAPGWFNDEADPRLARWFDGEAWTDHTVLKADWPGPETPPAPDPDQAWAPEATAVVPAYEAYEPYDSYDPYDPRTQVLSVRHQPSNVAKVVRRYRVWPLWARVAAPAVVVLLLAFVLWPKGDNTDDVQTTTGTTITLDDAVDMAQAQLGTTVPRTTIQALISAICANDATAAATEAAGATTDPQAAANLIGATGTAAGQRCPTVVSGNPGLLNRVQAATQALISGTSTSLDMTTSSIDLSATSSSSSTSTTKKPGGTTTTKAPTTTTTAATTTSVTTPETVPPEDCDPDYSGCLDPNTSYTCAGAPNAGPNTTGPVHVVGSDHLSLDTNGDGTACGSGDF